MRQPDCTILIAGLAVIHLLHLGHSFPYGGPSKTCANLLPKHSGTEPQTTAPPYELDISVTSYSQNDILNVTLKSKSSVGFKGFIFRVYRVTGDVEDNIGKFLSWPADSAISKSWYPDQGGPNCVTHKNNDVKTELTVTWQAPSKSVGDIIFSAGVVQSFSVFWANVSSSIIRSNTPSQDPPFPSVVSTKFNPIDLRECGLTKGCWLYPRTCSGDSCEHGVTFKDEGNTTVFEMFGTASGYISLGLSKDKIMGEDATISCTANSLEQHVSVQNGYNPAHNNEQHRILGITDIQLSRNEGQLSCRFRYPKVMTLTTISEKRTTAGDVLFTPLNKTFDLDDDFYLFLAWGNIYTGTNVLAKHSELPLITTSVVDLQDPSLVSGSGIPVMIQIHGTFMLIAWMTLASFGVVVARHYKHIFTKFVCGTKRWFQIHRGVMSALYILTMVSMVLIIAHVQGWTQYALIHSIFGMIAIGLSTLQVLAGLLRPDATSKNRPIFNWVHRIFGQVSHICAAVAMLLAYNVALLPAFVQKWGFIVTAVWIGIQVAWEIIFEIMSCCYEDEGPMVDAVAGDKGDINKSYTASSKEKLAKKVAFVLYSITHLIFLVTSMSFLYIY